MTINRRKGITFILISSFCFALMSLCVKSVPNIPLAEKMFFRNFIGLIALLPSIVKSKSLLSVHNKSFLFLRCTFGLLGVAFYYWTISQLPLGNAVIIHKMSPIFVMILSVFFLKERITRKQAFAIILALCGVMLIVKPRLDIAIMPSLFGLLGALFAGAAYTCIKHLSKTDSATTIVFYFCLSSSIATIPIMLVNGFVIPTLYELLFLLGIGISALVAQIFMTNAYRHAPASELAIYTYANPIFSFVLGFVIFLETPDLLTILGGTLIIIAALYSHLSKKNSPVT